MLLDQLLDDVQRAPSGAGLFVPPLIRVADRALSLRQSNLDRDTRPSADLDEELPAAGRVDLAARRGIPGGRVLPAGQKLLLGLGSDAGVGDSFGGLGREGLSGHLRLELDRRQSTQTVLSSASVVVALDPENDR